MHQDFTLRQLMEHGNRLEHYLSSAFSVNVLKVTIVSKFSLKDLNRALTNNVGPGLTIKQGKLAKTAIAINMSWEPDFYVGISRLC